MSDRRPLRRVGAGVRASLAHSRWADPRGCRVTHACACPPRAICHQRPPTPQTRRPYIPVGLLAKRATHRAPRAAAAPPSFQTGLSASFSEHRPHFSFAAPHFSFFLRAHLVLSLIIIIPHQHLAQQHDRRPPSSQLRQGRPPRALHRTAARSSAQPNPTQRSATQQQWPRRCARGWPAWPCSWPCSPRPRRWRCPRCTPRRRPRSRPRPGSSSGECRVPRFSSRVWRMGWRARAKHLVVVFLVDPVLSGAGGPWALHSTHHPPRAHDHTTIAKQATGASRAPRAASRPRATRTRAKQARARQPLARTPTGL